MKISNKLLGGLFIAIGALCVLYPVFSSLWIEIFVGASFFVGAVFSFLKFPSAASTGEKIIFALTALLYAVGGLCMMFNPLAGSIAMLAVIGIIFLLEGVIVIACATKFSAARVPMFFNGAVSILLGVILLANLEMALWAIGMLVGIDLIFTGISLLALPAPLKK